MGSRDQFCVAVLIPLGAAPRGMEPQLSQANNSLDEVEVVPEQRPAEPELKAVEHSKENGSADDFTAATLVAKEDSERKKSLAINLSGLDHCEQPIDHCEILPEASNKAEFCVQKEVENEIFCPQFFKQDQVIIDENEQPVTKDGDFTKPVNKEKNVTGNALDSESTEDENKVDLPQTNLELESIENDQSIEISQEAQSKENVIEEIEYNRPEIATENGDIYPVTKIRGTANEEIILDHFEKKESESSLNSEKNEDEITNGTTKAETVIEEENHEAMAVETEEVQETEVVRILMEPEQQSESSTNTLSETGEKITEKQENNIGNNGEKNEDEISNFTTEVETLIEEENHEVMVIETEEVQEKEIVRTLMEPEQQSESSPNTLTETEETITEKQENNIGDNGEKNEDEISNFTTEVEPLIEEENHEAM